VRLHRTDATATWPSAEADTAHGAGTSPELPGYHLNRPERASRARPSTGPQSGNREEDLCSDMRL